MNTAPVSMFQTAELGQRVAKPEYKDRELSIRTELLGLQRQLRNDKASAVLIDLAGVSGAGKSTSVNDLNKWMDPRWIHTYGYYETTDVEKQRPEFWRYWRDMPPRGEIGIYLSGRYHRPLLDFVHHRIDERELERLCDRINRFEADLTDDGALLVKFWMHINRDVQKARLEKLENDPLRQWRVKPVDWENWEIYDRFLEAAALIISHTNTGDAPWLIIDGEDRNFRSLAVGDHLRERLQTHVRQTALRKAYRKQLDKELDDLPENARPSSGKRTLTILDSVDLSLSLEDRLYRERLKELQARLAVLHGRAVVHGLSTILAFEGPDASGKGGTIRRMVRTLDARTYRINPIAAPTHRELAHQHLWRFWMRLPRAGRMAVFDRSWYGRVLVERIEGFATTEEWKRAYAEINDFEEQLTEHGWLVRKFWIHISNEEQLKRFKAREITPHKKWKLTEEDWRNREKWDDYGLAVHEMIQHTSTPQAPWTIVENTDKKYGRIKVLETVCNALEHLD